MRKITKLMLTLALLVAGVGENSVFAELIVTKTPVILTGGKFAECFTPGTYIIQMQGWQSFVAYEDATGVAFDENSNMVFDLEETVANGNVRVTFTFDGTYETKDWGGNDITTNTLQAWWCLGTGESADDTSAPYYKSFDESTFWLKKGFGDNFDKVKDFKITKVTVDNFNLEEGEEGNKTAVLVTYKVNGGTVCGQTMTIKNANATTFGAYGGVFTATTAQSNIFKMENFEVGDYQKVVIKFGAAVPATGNWAYNYQSGVWPPSIGAGKTELEIPLNGTNLPELTIFNWEANPDPINISEVYLYKEVSSDVLLTFNEYGFATSNIKDLTAEGGLSYNASTGVLTSDGTAGTLTLEFTNPVDLKNLNTFNVKRSGNSNIVNRLKFYDNDGDPINTWNNAKWNNDGLDYNATNAFKTHNDVKKLVWESDAAEGNNGETLTISAIEWQLKTIGAMKGTDITTLPYKEWSADGDNDATVVGDATPTKNIGVVTGNVVYGSDAISDSKKYIDLTNYKKLIVRGYGNIRLFYNWHQSTGDGDAEVKSEKSLTNNTTTVQALELDIPAFMEEKGISHFHLVGIKTNWGEKLFVESISAIGENEKFDYAISGKGGLILQSATEALSDETATAIDATGLTNDTRLKETLNPANPNCLIFVNSDQLSNPNNVVVDGTCASLVITDGKPFKAPIDFTATTTSYDRTFTQGANQTICLPFTLSEETVAAAGTFYELAEATTDNLRFTSVTETEANKPYLFVPSSATPTLSATGASVTTDDAGATTANGVTFQGVFNETTIEPATNYTLFAFTASGEFVKISSGSATLKGMRAYLSVPNALVSGSRMNISFDNEMTGISENVEMRNVANQKFFDLQGRSVKQPAKGLYIVNGKKYIVK